ncbi:MAG: TolC family protein [Gemmatimonadales bacterium]
MISCSATPRKAKRALWLLAATLLAVPAMADAQVLTLRDALRRADQAGFANRIAAGQSAAQAGQGLAPYRGILPTIRMETSYLATTDPLNAFGFALRQRAVTPAAFAPSSLNNPNAIGNLTTGVVVEQPLFNADSWLGRKAAATASQATAAQERWTRSGTAVDVVRAYWGAVLSREQEHMLRSALEAAQSHVRQAESLVRQGMATRSDALLASVKAGQVEAALLSARSQVRLARLGLALLMGEPAESTFALPGVLPSAEQVQFVSSRATTENMLPVRRADVEAATLARDAAVADARRASALYLPRLNGFGRLDWNAPTAPFGGKSAWTLGLMLSWSPFAGASELAEIRTASGRRRTAVAMAEAAEATAGLDRSRTTDAVPLAQARLEIAGRGIAQASEAHRIVGRKYEGGLASVTELLDAAAIETTAELAEVAARYELIVATAESRRAQGLDLSPLQDLEPLVNQ